MGDASLKQHWVGTELCVDKWHVAVDTYEEVDAFVALVEMFLLHGQRLRTARAPERPPRRHLNKQGTS